MSQNSENTFNEYVKGITFNAQVMLDAIDLGPPPQMIRTPSYHDYEGEELVCDGSFQDNYVIPEPCLNCYTFNCNEMSCQEMATPQPLTRMLTNAHLPYSDVEKEALLALAEAESNMRDEYEAEFFKGLEDKKQDQDQDPDQDK